MSSNNITPQQLRILAGLLAIPDEDSLAVLEEISQQNSWLTDSFKELKTIPLEHWQAEHTGLFVNGYPKTPCIPFESAYRHSIMNGHVCGEIERIYQSVGLETIEDLSPDYLGVMLECAAFLLEQTLTPQANSGEDTEVHPEEFERNFQALWQDHLAKWVPKFANDLQEHSQLRLYRTVGLKLKELFDV